MKPRFLPSNCLLQVYNELFACFCMDKFAPGGGYFEALVRQLHLRYPRTAYGEEVSDEIDLLAERAARWAMEISTQYRELHDMLQRFPASVRKRRQSFDLIQDAIHFSSLPVSHKNLLGSELRKLRRRQARGLDPIDLLSELFLRYHTRILAQELHLRVSEPLLRTVDQVLRTEILSNP